MGLESNPVTQTPDGDPSQQPEIVRTDQDLFSETDATVGMVGTVFSSPDTRPEGIVVGQDPEHWPDANVVPLFDGLTEGPIHLPEILGNVARVRAEPDLFPKTADEAVERVMRVREGAQNGRLYEDALHLGIDPVWVRQLLNEPVRVALSEQVMPLPTLFAKLGQFGSPAALARSLYTIQNLAQRLELADSSIGPVKLGQITSLDHGVTFKDITSGFYFLVPLVSPGVDQETIQGRHLFSSQEKKRFNGAAYRDLVVTTDKILDVIKSIDEVLSYSQRAAQKSVSAAERQRAFNDESREKQFPVTSEQAARVEEGFRKGARLFATAAAASAFVTDCSGALQDLGIPAGAKGVRVNYCDFVSAYNARLVGRFLPEFNFETVHTDHANTLPIFGITNWNLFLTRVFDSGMIRPDEPILRLRVAEPGKDVEYRSLVCAARSEREVSLIDKYSGVEYRLGELIDQSRDAVLAGKPPLLVPIASLRYLVNYTLSSSIYLDDGMPYDKVQRLHRAMRDPEFTIFPRDLTLVPYTRLNTYTPQDPANPYDGLRPPRHDVLDYYRFASVVSGS